MRRGAMAFPSTHVIRAGLLLVSFLSGSSGIVYVQTVSDIQQCNMKCPEAIGALELYRICRGEGEDPLVEYFCQLLSTKNHNPSRVHLDPSSGCWTLTCAQRSDSCVYNVHHYGLSIYLLSSTDIRVLDPVLITNITSNSSRLGEDIAVSVHYSGEESAVSWELEGERLPDRYRLIDDNRTLIIPSVQRGDAERRFRVTVTNPVSEETREYGLKMTDPHPPKRQIWPAVIAVVFVLLVVPLGCAIRYWLQKRRKRSDEKTSKTAENVALNGCSYAV